MLANRRLFMGETDLDTVRQVQAAAVPPLRQFNPSVPPELEAVLARTLTSDPADRYQSARELGRDLNQILFGCGRSVSSFDIAELVAPIISDRERRGRQKVLDKGSVIGSLIDEALFEFTSLQEGESDERNSSEVGSSPLNLGSFDNIEDWAASLGDLGGGKGSSSERQFEVGNLAALEDEPTGVGRRSAVDMARIERARAELSRSMPPPVPEAQVRHTRLVIILVVLLALTVGLLGAHIAGVLPAGALSR